MTVMLVLVKVEEKASATSTVYEFSVAPELISTA